MRGKIWNFKCENELADLIEAVRIKIGLTRSEFVRQAIVRQLEQYSVISKKVREED